MVLATRGDLVPTGLQGENGRRVSREKSLIVHSLTNKLTSDNVGQSVRQTAGEPYLAIALKAKISLLASWSFP